jgi:arylsulfatase A-like enzyme
MDTARRRSRLLVPALILMVPWTAAATNTRAADRPDVLLICIDDLNDWVGCLGGHPQAKTPHMDRLARRGTVFLNAHCQAPLCNPSRTSFLTGLRPTTSGVYALEPWFRTAPPWKDRTTLPQALEQAGYTTATTGKVFHDAYPPPDGRKDGPEFSTWGYHGNFGPRPATKFVTTPDNMPLMDWGPFPERDEDQEDAKVADWAIARLKESTDAPRFLAVGFRRPHVPCYAPQKWFELFPDADLQLPPVKRDDRDDIPAFAWFLHWKLPEPRLRWLEQAHQWRPLVRAYLASTSFVDGQVGRVLDALDASGRADRTIVVLISDHGWHLGEKGISGKNTLWERSTRVPLIVAGPGVTPGGVCRSPAELLDVFPTLVELCRAPEVPGLEGHSLAPQLRDAAAPRPWPAITSQGPGNHAVRSEKYRLIRYADGSEELYDLDADPNEWTNRAGDPALKTVKDDLAAWLPRSSAPPLPGSRSRLVELRPDGSVWWEGKKIGANDPVPED